MSKVVSKGYTDTPSGSGPFTIARADLNFKEDFRVKANTPGKEVVLTNITCPIDRPEMVRIQYSDVGNIYSGSGIEPSVLAPTKRGVRVYIGLTETVSVSDTTDPSYRVDLPLQCSLMIKAPVSENITASDITTAVGRLLSCLFETGAVDTARLEAILRGSLTPSDL